jgi:hypothetical protein
MEAGPGARGLRISMRKRLDACQPTFEAGSSDHLVRAVLHRVWNLDPHGSRNARIDDQLEVRDLLHTGSSEGLLPRMILST